MLKKSKIYHFPVGNGDMTLLEIASGDKYVRILCDMHIRSSSDRNIEGFDVSQCDVIAKLHELLDRDGSDRPYVDALILTHPDEDHIRGYEKYFHTGGPEDYKESKDGEYDKIFVREMWSSPLIFRRKQKTTAFAPMRKHLTRRLSAELSYTGTTAMLGWRETVSG